MKFRLNYTPSELIQKVVAKQLNKIGVSFSFNELGQLVLDGEISGEIMAQMTERLRKLGITMSETGMNSIVGDIKNAIEELVYSEDIRKTTISVYLSNKLGYSYSYLSNLFSEETYTSIENFIILRKIEYTKHLILEEDMSLTEIAYKLDYSSVAHLSGQFKKVTGLTPTTFLRILQRRKTKNT